MDDVTNGAEIAEVPPWVVERLGPSDNGHCAGSEASDPLNGVALVALRRLGGHSERGTDKGFIITRPGKAGTGTSGSATVGVVGPGVVKMFTSGWPPFEKNATYDAEQVTAIADAQEASDPDLAQRCATGVTDPLIENTRVAGADEDSGTGGSKKKAGDEQQPAEKAPSPKRWFNRDGLLVADLGEHIREALTVRLGYDDRLYRYDRGVYRPDGERAARVLARKEIGRRFKRRHLDEVVVYLKTAFPFIPERPPLEFINVKNGLLDWATGELVPHSPDVASAVQVPVAWRPGAVCPAIDKFLAEALPDDAVDHGLEILGYELYPGNPLQQAVMLLGPGGNGKTTFLTLARHLCGAANFSAVSLQALGENRFAAAELFGRLANICGDLDARAIKRTDLFKQLTGGDPIMAERKFGHPFTFVCFALPIFSANEPPKSADQTDAWFDRWRIVPFDVRFRGTEREDPHLDGKITARAELEGLLVKAVGALQRLMDRGRFEPPESCQGATALYRDQLDTVRGFVGECVVFDVDAWTARSDFYQSYRGWAAASGRFPVSADRCYAHLLSSHADRVEERRHLNTRGFGGIRVVWSGSTKPEDLV